MTGKNKAVFLDRDGVINELVYHQEAGVIDSPFTVAQLKLMPGVAVAINKLHEIGFLVIVVSNQPGIAKGHLSNRTFQKIRKKIGDELAKGSARLDGEYYCLHSPEATIAEFKVSCDCRKPRPGLLFRAAEAMGIDLSKSWMVGDNLSDIKAGAAAGCRTVLVGKRKCELCNLMDEESVKPNVIVPNVTRASEVILSTGGDSIRIVGLGGGGES